MELIPEAIELYVSDHTEPPDDLRRQLIEETHRDTDLPQMQSGQVEGLLLKFLVASLNTKLVVEVGTFTGYSAMMMAEGLAEGGKVITCDVSEEYTTIAKRYWAKHPDGNKIELRLGPALETLGEIDGPIDFAFIDADKENYTNYWEAIVPKMRPNGIIAVDNVLWDGRVLDPKEPSDHAIVAFNEHALKDERMEVVMLSVRDGVTLARKR